MGRSRRNGSYKDKAGKTMSAYNQPVVAAGPRPGQVCEYRESPFLSLLILLPLHCNAIVIKNLRDSENVDTLLFGIERVFREGYINPEVQRLTIQWDHSNKISENDMKKICNYLVPYAGARMPFKDLIDTLMISFEISSAEMLMSFFNDTVQTKALHIVWRFTEPSAAIPTPEPRLEQLSLLLSGLLSSPSLDKIFIHKEGANFQPFPEDFFRFFVKFLTEMREIEISKKEIWIIDGLEIKRLALPRRNEEEKGLNLPLSLRNFLMPPPSAAPATAAPAAPHTVASASPAGVSQTNS